MLQMQQFILTKTLTSCAIYAMLKESEPAYEFMERVLG